jgi:DNA-binding CsgD family transcriptional regulator
VIGPLSDLVALQAIARAARLPLLLIALHFDEGGDILHFLTALQRVVSGTPFLAVPAGVIVQWATPLDRLTTREWEVIIGLALTADPAVVAQRSGLSIPSVETYAKRVRRKLGSGSLPETLALVQAHVTAQLGVAPTALYGFVDPAQRLR